MQALKNPNHPEAVKPFKAIVAVTPYSIKADLNAEAKLDDLIIDWIRLNKTIFIGNNSLERIFKQVGINLDDVSIIEDGNILITPRLRSKFKSILAQLVPEEFYPVDMEIYGKMAGLLHQGGLPFRLHKHIESALNENNLLFDSKMNKKLELHETETGFGLRTLFTCNGNIVSKDDVEDMKFEADDKLLVAETEQMVTFNQKGDMSVTVSSASLRSSVPQLVELICKETKEELRAALKIDVSDPDEDVPQGPSP